MRQSSGPEARCCAADGVPWRGSLSAFAACWELGRSHRAAALSAARAHWDRTSEFRLGGEGAWLTCGSQIGGATGSVGDPSGRSTERNALSSSDLDANAKAITKQVTSFLTRGVPFALSRSSTRNASFAEEGHGGEVRVENNLEWLGGMKLLEFLSTVGKTARMATMLSRERYVASSSLSGHWS